VIDVGSSDVGMNMLYVKLGISREMTDVKRKMDVGGQKLEKQKHIVQ